MRVSGEKSWCLGRATIGHSLCPRAQMRNSFCILATLVLVFGRRQLSCLAFACSEASAPTQRGKLVIQNPGERGEASYIYRSQCTNQKTWKQRDMDRCHGWVKTFFQDSVLSCRLLTSYPVYASRNVSTVKGCIIHFLDMIISAGLISVFFTWLPFEGACLRFLISVSSINMGLHYTPLVCVHVL